MYHTSLVLLLYTASSGTFVLPLAVATFTRSSLHLAQLSSGREDLHLCKSSNLIKLTFSIFWPAAPFAFLWSCLWGHDSPSAVVHTLIVGVSAPWEIYRHSRLNGMNQSAIYFYILRLGNCQTYQLTLWAGRIRSSAGPWTCITKLALLQAGDAATLGLWPPHIAFPYGSICSTKS